MKLSCSAALVILLPLFIACKKDKHRTTACGVDDPVKNIAWLKNTVDSLSAKTMGGTITLMSYNGNDYFALNIIPMSCAYCYWYTCTGAALTYPADTTLIKTLSTNTAVERKVLLQYGLQ